MDGKGLTPRRGEKRGLPPFDHDGRERAAVGSTAVKVQSVAVVRGSVNGSVTVHDEEAEAGGFGQERLADPDEVGFGLVLQRDAIAPRLSGPRSTMSPTWIT